MPKVTVLMPAYNAEAHIKQAIESILNQTFTDFEFLIIDDGSTDNTVNIINSFSDQRIRLIKNKENLGLAKAPNKALLEAKGELIARMDSDDISLPDRLKTQIGYFDRDIDLALLGSSAYVINSNGERTGELMIPTFGTNQLKATLLFHNSFTHSSTMMRKNILEKVGGYPIYSVAEDYALFSKIALFYKINNISDILVEYRVHNKNMTFLKQQEFHYYLQEILKSNLNLLSLSYESTDLDIIITPTNDSPYSIEQYADIYSKIILQNKKNNIFPSKELKKFILNKWFNIIMEKGKNNLFKYYFKAPIYDAETFNFKHIRRLFKQSVKNIFN